MTALFDLPGAEPNDLDSIGFHVLGTPTPQGSKRAFLNKKTGRPVVVEQQHDRIRTWRADVVAAVHAGLPDDWRPLDGPVRLVITFRLQRPKAHYRTGRNAHVLRDDAPHRPARMPDIDKLARSTCDALKTAGLYLDDGQVVELNASKVYTEPDAGEQPGATITARPL